MDDLKYPPTPRGGGGIFFLSDFVFPLPLKSVGCLFSFLLSLLHEYSPHIFPSCNSSEGCHLDGWTHSCLI